MNPRASDHDPINLYDTSRSTSKITCQHFLVFRTSNFEREDISASELLAAPGREREREREREL